MAKIYYAIEDKKNFAIRTPKLEEEVEYIFTSYAKAKVYCLPHEKPVKVRIVKVEEGR